ncbi:unnamed protein product [Clonostachys rhizophaga]|uniref:Uncharacterized protein n=1 Tax=Clonostachys rhizophaga TaxID=160324 RepID=A0A9N9VJQ3_9HYPO|nr:unnamed protein product [Clonostachys rhizophaga]
MDYRFKLSDSVRKLAADVKDDLGAETPLRRRINSEGVEVGAKGSVFEWDARDDSSHNLLFIQTMKDHRLTH